MRLQSPCAQGGTTTGWQSLMKWLNLREKSNYVPKSTMQRFRKRLATQWHHCVLLFWWLLVTHHGVSSSHHLNRMNIFRWQKNKCPAFYFFFFKDLAWDKKKICVVFRKPNFKNKKKASDYLFSISILSFVTGQTLKWKRLDMVYYFTLNNVSTVFWISLSVLLLYLEDHWTNFCVAGTGSSPKSLQ